MEQQLNNINVSESVRFASRPQAGTKELCRSTGGTITYTNNGLIHQGGKRYNDPSTGDSDE